MIELRYGRKQQHTFGRIGSELGIENYRMVESDYHLLGSVENNGKPRFEVGNNRYT